MGRSSDSGGCGSLIIIVIVIFALIKCNDSDSKDARQDGTQKIEVEKDSGRDHKTTKNTVTVVPPSDPDYDRYINNRLSDGSRPYTNEKDLRGDDSRISVKTSSGNDVVVILKQNGYMVKNSYVRAGHSVSFDIPNGRYQIFFYSGNGWNPNKQMPNGMKGGFVSNELFSKDNPQDLSYQILEYELIPQRNGNFQTKASNPGEVFN